MTINQRYSIIKRYKPSQSEPLETNLNTMVSRGDNKVDFPKRYLFIKENLGKIVWLCDDGDQYDVV